MLDLLITEELQLLSSYLGRDLSAAIVREVARVLLFSCCLHVAGLVVPVADPHVAGLVLVPVAGPVAAGALHVVGLVPVAEPHGADLVPVPQSGPV